ncbi:TetR/AcrR family transcriptional regulator [Actinokineospora sp. G85]|uniref:TetR/AcrR family transcriptional regulator n=1 Tax=Actinokineospora sp. G85 TaxID=3406626 RepID=UPI003C738A4A
MGTRDELIDSARALLWERGYVGTSPKAIQQRAGVGQGSMYHHFTGKRDLALAAVRRNADELLSGADERLSGPGTAIDRVSAYLRRERDALKGCPIGGLAQDPEVVADPQLRAPVDQALGHLRERITAVLDEGRAAGELPATLDTAALAATVVAVVQGGYVLARAADTTEPFDQAVSGALALLGHVSGAAVRDSRAGCGP